MGTVCKKGSSRRQIHPRHASYFLIRSKHILFIFHSYRTSDKRKVALSLALFSYCDSLDLETEGQSRVKKKALSLATRSQLTGTPFALSRKCCNDAERQNAESPGSMAFGTCATIFTTSHVLRTRRAKVKFRDCVSGEWSKAYAHSHI